MSDLSFPRKERDPLTGEIVCDPCWNSKHWHQSTELGRTIVVWDCTGPPCECHCRKLFLEQSKKLRRVKPDYTNQEVFNGFESSQSARGHKKDEKEFVIPPPFKAWCHHCDTGFMTISELQEHTLQLRVWKG